MVVKIKLMDDVVISLTANPVTMIAQLCTVERNSLNSKSSLNITDGL